MKLARLRRRLPDLLRGILRGHPGVRIGPRVRLTGPGRYDLHRGSRICEGAQLYVGPDATLRVAAGAKIGIRNIVNVASGVSIAAGVEISWDVQILDTDFHWIKDADGVVRDHTRPIAIGRHVLIGTGALILKGVNIGDGAVVGAGSVVRQSVPAKTIVAGNPAGVVGHVEEWGSPSAVPGSDPLTATEGRSASAQQASDPASPEPAS
jgi:acetyltransferase-like isoleucine patch superfamily enzyme